MKKIEQLAVATIEGVLSNREVVGTEKKEDGSWQVEIKGLDSYKKEDSITVSIAEEKEFNAIFEEKVKNSAWSFKADFITDVAGLKESESQEAIITMQKEHCENCNEVVLKLLGDLRWVIGELKLRGEKGNIINGYDGKLIKKDGYYIWYN